MVDLANLDASVISESESFEPLPAGDYTVIVNGAQMKANSKNTGEILVLRFEVMDGPYKGRLLWDNLNIKNPNEKAVAISMTKLAHLCESVGAPGPGKEGSNTDKILNIPLSVKVTVKEGRNNIIDYDKCGAAPITTGAVADTPW